jgi:hypothetical protein
MKSGPGFAPGITATELKNPTRQWIRRFILFHNKRHSRQLGAPEVEAFLSGLATETFGAMRCAYCALPRFFMSFACSE